MGKFSQAQLKQARSLRAQGNGRGGLMAWVKIGQIMGVNGFSLRLALDEACVRVRREENEILEFLRGLRMAEETTIVPHNILVERDRLLAIPRTLTAILMGDPLPGRSALDKRGA